jgi:hypothetical protein
MRASVSLVAALLILGPLLMWLLVRLDWLDATSLRVGPPLVVIGLAVLLAERFLAGRRGRRR